MQYFITFVFYALLLVGGAFIAKCIERAKKNKAIRERRIRNLRQYRIPAQRKGN